MTFLKLLLSGALIYIAAMASLIPEPDRSLKIVQHCEFDYTLSDYIRPLNYKMELMLSRNYPYGKCRIIINIMYATQYISFHAPSWMRLMNPELKQLNSEETYKIKLTYSHEDNIVVLDFVHMLSPNIYILNTEFDIPVNEAFYTLYTNQEGDTEWLFATGIQSKRQQIFPSWDKPEFKITFDISITHDRGYNALSNMPIRQKSKSVYDNMVWTSFDNTSLISINDVAFVVSALNQTTNSAESISIWCRPQLIPYVKFALFVAENVTMYLENYWNNSKKVLLSSEEKVDHVAIPDFQGEVKQTLGFVFYREADIIYNEELDPVARKIIIARSVARETARKYFGNLLNPSHCFHLWLNEGFIMFLQAYIIDKALPDFRMMDLFVVQSQHDILDLNTYFVINSDIEYDNYPENYFQSSLSYIKGSIIWRMLERTLPPDVFFKGINRYLINQFDYPKATASNDLWTAMQAAISTSDLKYHILFDVKGIVNAWAIQSCFPVLEVKRNYSSDVVTISVQFDHKLDEKQYYIPLTYTTESDLNFDKTWPDVCLTQWYSETEFSLEKDQWIIVNLQQAGYYRVNYDAENWRKIASYLNSAEYSNIHILNRAQIIDDAFYFAIEKKLNFSVFWELANYLSKETDYIAWYPMFKALEFISNIFAYLEFYPEFEEVQESLKFIEAHSYIEASTPKYTKDDHTRCLKQEFAKWGCIINDILCKETANYQLQLHLEDPKEHKLSPGWKKWIYCNGLKDATNVTWNEVFHLCKKKFEHTILESLTCSEKPEIIIGFLKKLLPIIITTTHNQSNPHYLWFEHLERSNALTANIFLTTLARNTRHMHKDLLNNFKNIKPGSVSDRAALTVIINNMYSKEQLDEINKFVKEKMENLIFDVESKIETRLSEIEKQTEYLQSLFSQLEN